MANVKLPEPYAFSVGRYTCEMRFTEDGLKVEWDPHIPHSLTPAQLKLYRVERDAFLAEVSDALGIPVLAIDVAESTSKK